MYFVPDNIKNNPLELFTNNQKATDYIDSRVYRSGGTYMPISVMAKSVSVENVGKVNVEVKHAGILPGTKWNVKIRAYPIICMVSKEDQTQNTRIHTTATWQLTVNEMKRHNLKSEYLMNTKFGKWLIDKREEENEIFINYWKKYIEAVIDNSDYSKDNFIQHAVEHKHSSTGGKIRYSQLIVMDELSKEYKLTTLGEEAYIEAKTFVTKFWHMLYRKVEALVKGRFFYRTEYRFPALRNRPDEVPIPIKEFLEYKVVTSRNRIANGLKGNNITNFALIYNHHEGFKKSYTKLLSVMEKEDGIKMISPMSEGIEAYLQLIDDRKNLKAYDISTADKQMPLFSWAMDVTSYAGLATINKVSTLAESSGGSGTAPSNAIYLKRILSRISEYLGIQKPKKIYGFGDNIAEGDDFLNKAIEQDAEIEEFIGRSSRWLGISLNTGHAQGIKFTVDSADKAISLGNKSRYDLVQKDKVPKIEDITSVAFSKDIIAKFGGPTFRQLIGQKTDRAEEYISSRMYHFQHNLSKIYRETTVYEKGQRVIESLKDILFGENFKRSYHQLQKEID